MGIKLSVHAMFTTRARVRQCLWILWPRTFPCAMSCLVGLDKLTSLIHIVNIFQCYKQCRGGQCLPNRVQVDLCAKVVINIEIVELTTEKHPPFKIVVTFRGKKSKWGMDKSRSISWWGLKFPILRNVGFKYKDKFRIKKRHQQLQISTL